MSEAKPDRWMPLFIGDYKKDTGRLTRDQHGGYLLLIMEYWNTGPLPDDDQELAAVALADAKEWRKLRPKLERFFVIGEGLWRHKRIDAELERWTDRKAKATERAQAAAAARWNGKPDAQRNASSIARRNARGNGQAMLEGCPQSQSVEEEDPNRSSSLYQGEVQNPDFTKGAAARFIAEMRALEEAEACPDQPIA